MDFINEQNKSKLLLKTLTLSLKSRGLTTLKNDESYLFRQNVEYISIFMV